jgi:hypothetical protein
MYKNNTSAWIFIIIIIIIIIIPLDMNHIRICHSFIVVQREMIRLKPFYTIIRLIFFHILWVEYPNIFMNARSHSIHVRNFTRVSTANPTAKCLYSPQCSEVNILTTRNPSRFHRHHHSKAALSCRNRQCVGFCYSLCYCSLAWSHVSGIGRVSEWAETYSWLRYSHTINREWLFH